MSDPRLRRASPRLAGWFAATTLLLTVVLAWLGWVMVRQDRDLERQAQREQAVEVAVAALARTLAELDETMSTATVSPAASLGPIGSRAAIVAFDASGVVSRAGVALPYYPAVPATPGPQSDLFAAADLLEHARRDSAGAIRSLLPLAQSANPAVRAETWLRLARNYKKLGDSTGALDAFQQLASLGDQPVQGMPAGLTGRMGRALVLADTKRESDLQREAAELSHDLAAGRWLVTPAQYENSAQQVRAWIGNPEAVAIDADRASLAAAAEAVWRDWQASGGRARDPRGRRTEWTGDRSVLALTRDTPQQLAVMLVSTAALNDAWSANLRVFTTRAWRGVQLLDRTRDRPRRNTPGRFRTMAASR
jgi:hypothetical protein